MPCALSSAARRVTFIVADSPIRDSRAASFMRVADGIIAPEAATLIERARTRAARRPPHLLLALLALLLGFAARSTTVGAAPPAAEGWLDDLAAARARAKSESKPILVDLWADWCTWCKRLERDVFSTPVFQQFAEKLRPAAGRHRGRRRGHAPDGGLRGREPADHAPRLPRPDQDRRAAGLSSRRSLRPEPRARDRDVRNADPCLRRPSTRRQGRGARRR